MMPSIDYRTTDITEIALIGPYWIQLNDYHSARAKTFKDHYPGMILKDRKACFDKVAAAGSLRLDLALDLEACGR